MFMDYVVLKAWERDDEDNLIEAARDGTDVEDVLDSSMEYDTYSSISLILSSYKMMREITTLTFEIMTEQSGYLNLVIKTDDDVQYETGQRYYTAGRSVSYIIAPITYPASTYRFEFRNERPSEGLADGEEYEGYEIPWKLMYVQTVYNERS